MRFLSGLCLSFTFLLVLSGPVRGEPERVYSTASAVIQYRSDEDLDEFIWRLGGARLEFREDPALASYRIDRLINRVQMILDMWPEDLRVRIRLHPGPSDSGREAHYDPRTRVIDLAVVRVSEGVVAHELAHAVIHAYFQTPPPGKMQEILAQYVDRHLWSDY